MLYELFMFWVVGSISVVVASMVLGGLLCVWCAYKGSKHSQLSSLTTRATKTSIDLFHPTNSKPRPPSRRSDSTSRSSASII
jgi:hypothetical protein